MSSRGVKKQTSEKKDEIKKQTTEPKFQWAIW
jgi:hypothetical protein